MICLVLLRETSREVYAVYFRKITLWEDMRPRVPQNIRVFVYELPSILNVDLFRFNPQMSGWAQMYDVEVIVHRFFQRHPDFTTTNWEHADYYFVPVYPTRYMHALRVDRKEKVLNPEYTAEAIDKAFSHINSSFPSWRDRRDRHLLVLSHDFARCMLGRMPSDYIRTHPTYKGRPDLFDLFNTTLAITLLGDRSARFKYNMCASASSDIIVPPVAQFVGAYDLFRYHPFKNQRPRLAFLGGAIRQGHPWYSYGVRQELLKLFANDTEILIRDGHMEHAEHVGILNSTRFCLSPGGYQTWSPRPYTAIIAGCIPVFFHRPGEVRLPWDDTLDYEEFAVFVPTKLSNLTALKNLKVLLGRVRGQQLERMQRRLAEVRHAFGWSLTGDECGAMENIISSLQALPHATRN